MDLQHFTSIWQRNAVSAQADFWNRRADAFNDNKKDVASGNMRVRFLDWIAGRIPLKNVGSILDVGCGTGHHLLALGALAGQGCRLEGVDISSKMIDFARENALKARMGHAVFRVLDWNAEDMRAFGWEKTFDLVLAIRTPALGCKADLDTLIAASRDYCAVITEASKRSALRDMLVPVLYPDASKNPVCGADRASQPLYCLANTLWLMGYYPEISYMEYSWEADWSLEDTLMIQQSHFESKQALAPQQARLLATTLQDVAVEGRVHERVSTKVALVSWRVGDVG